ncbi:TetR family transcriptional regulator [Sphingobium xenophagum]|uniref:TetR family transcriptional regulator n=1 Tax=Sphingobium xenophagum TaxID=121428 RepID=UPI0003A4AEFC|nr:TetR family transcriptional regulator [Sphingobium xenophagum]
MDAALSEFASKGLQGARAEEIARQSGAAKRMIYYYFTDKEGLYRAAIQHAFSSPSALGNLSDLEDMATLPALEEMIGRTFDMHVERPDFVRLLLQENFQHGEHIRTIPEISQGTRSTIATWRKLLDRGIREGLVREDVDPVKVHHSISALGQFYISNQYSLKANFDIDSSLPETVALQKKHVIDMICRWILRPSTKFGPSE